MNVLVYAGPETHPPALAATLAAVRDLLAPHHPVQPLAAAALADPWPATCALLVLPELRALAPAAAAAIPAFVAGGGRLLVLATGAHYAARATGALRLHDTPSGTSLAPTFNPDAAGEAETASITLASGEPLDGVPQSRARALPSSGPNITVLARYADGAPVATGARYAARAPGDIPPGALRLHDTPSGTSLAPTFNPDAAGEAETASITLASGERLDGVRQSRARTLPSSGPNITVLARYAADGAPAAIAATLGAGGAVLWAPNIEAPLADAAHDAARRAALRSTLEALGLRVPDPAAAPAATHPLPQFLTGAPGRGDVVRRIVDAVAGGEGAGAGLKVFEDANDTFEFHALGAGAEVLARARAEVPGEAQQTKHIIVCADGLPDARDTPLFDIGAYYAALAEEREAAGCDAGAPWGVGEALLYGEGVTSTQTMLDRNPRLLGRLPGPVVSLASHQLAGRGRGGNVWVSPAGCLQFSLTLRVALAALPAARLVFVQYLFALAVAEACGTEAVAGAAGSAVRIKWPNDVYAVGADGERRKIGGVLVNTSFGAGMVDIVIGSGLNVLNAAPMPSLAQLLPRGAGPLRMERAAAAILARFAALWDVFLAARGAFAPFAARYYERWLHSDQLVTLTTVDPPRRVRIVGLTPEHGLLRTVPERTGWGGGGDAEFIDLQPDGNSFDLMAGMIRTKT